jgi:hypothetical protein
MKTSSVAAVFAACTLVLGCDIEPHVLFVTEGNPFQALQLTDAQEGCTAPYRVSYLASADGGTSSGCWVREGPHIRTQFPSLLDKLIPVGEFRRTTLADYRDVTLDD